MRLEPYIGITYAVGAISLVLTVIIFILLLGSCKPISYAHQIHVLASTSKFPRHLWLPPAVLAHDCRNLYVIMIIARTNAILGPVIDACLMAIPVWVVYTTMITSRKSVQVALVFSVGLFVVIAGIVRNVYIDIESNTTL